MQIGAHFLETASLGVAADEQNLERAGAAAEQNHGRGGARHRLLAGVQLLSLGRAGILHRPTLPGTRRGAADASVRFRPVKKWICGSCGFIYDPTDGDPDGGIPPGTAFEDIPETWFCPVCGARKADFEPYDD